MNPSFLLTQHNRVIAVLDNSEADALLLKARDSHCPIKVVYYDDANMWSGLAGIHHATITDLRNREFQLVNLHPYRTAIQLSIREEVVRNG